MRHAGLYDKWISDLYRELVETKRFSKNRTDYMETSEETDMKTFSVPIFIAYGWTAGIIVLVIEIIWKKFKFSIYRQMWQT